MSKLKSTLIVIAGIIAVGLMIVFGIQSYPNKAIGYEENIKTANSDIRVQEKRRVDLVYNLADCVKQYDKHEAETLTSIVDGRGSISDEDTGDAKLVIKAVTENYPELKSNDNYKQLMNELATTENLMAQYRENYNATVKTYNRYVKRFPARIFLNFTGYEVQEYEGLDYGAPQDAPQNLFDE